MRTFERGASGVLAGVKKRLEKINEFVSRTTVRSDLRITKRMLKGLSRNSVD